MKVTIHTIDGLFVEIKDFDPTTVMDLLDSLNDPTTQTLQFALGEEAATHIRRDAVVRVDVD